MDTFDGYERCEEQENISEDIIRPGVIYRATNHFDDNGSKAYIGKSVNFSARKRNHFSASFNPKSDDYNSYFHRAIRKYGKDVFIWDILLDNIISDDLSMYEKFFIALHSTYGKYGYNSTPGGEIVPSGKNHYLFGKHRSDETKKKLSAANLGKHHSDETKKKMSKASSGKNNHNFGKHHSEETKKKIAKGNEGKIVSYETKKKISEGNKDKIVSEETKKKMSAVKSGANNPQFGKCRSDETKKKISEATSRENNHNFGKSPSDKTKQKIAESLRALGQYNVERNMKIYKQYSEGKNIKDIQKEFGISMVTVYRAIKQISRELLGSRPTT